MDAWELYLYIYFAIAIIFSTIVFLMKANTISVISLALNVFGLVAFLNVIGVL